MLTLLLTTNICTQIRITPLTLFHAVAYLALVPPRRRRPSQYKKLKKQKDTSFESPKQFILNNAKFKLCTKRKRIRQDQTPS